MGTVGQLEADLVLAGIEFDLALGLAVAPVVDPVGFGLVARTGDDLALLEALVVDQHVEVALAHDGLASRGEFDALDLGLERDGRFDGVTVFGRDEPRRGVVGLVLRGDVLVVSVVGLVGVVCWIRIVGLVVILAETAAQSDRPEREECSEPPSCVRAA